LASTHARSLLGSFRSKQSKHTTEPAFLIIHFDVAGLLGHFFGDTFFGRSMTLFLAWFFASPYTRV
jgi:hypothetical protein